MYAATYYVVFYTLEASDNYQQFESAEVIGLTPRLNLFSRAGMASMRTLLPFTQGVQ